MFGDIISSIGLVLGFVGAILLLREVKLAQILDGRELPEWEAYFMEKAARSHQRIRELFAEDSEIQEQLDATKDEISNTAKANEFRRLLFERSTLRKRGAILIAAGFAMQFVGLWIAA